MVARVRTLDSYTRQVVAPLGILFPFPLLCRKLDSYMRSEGELQQAMAAMGGEAATAIGEQVPRWEGEHANKQLRTGAQL